MLSLLFALACTTPEPADLQPSPPSPAPAAASATVPSAARVNLNTATEAQLQAIPGMTPKMIHEFEEYRPYISITQFRKQIGKYVSAEQVAQWEPHVFVPVAPNECDAATLMQLPGVEKPTADALIEARPFANRAAFLTALEAAVGSENAAAAAELLK